MNEIHQMKLVDNCKIILIYYHSPECIVLKERVRKERKKYVMMINHHFYKQNTTEGNSNKHVNLI